MRYVLLVDPQVQEEIDGPSHLPEPVKAFFTQNLDDLQDNPHVGLTNVPVFGLFHTCEIEYGGMRWKFMVFLDRDDQAGILYVKQWVVITENV